MIPSYKFILDSFQSIKDWSEIEKYVESGYIYKRKHSVHDLWIYKYKDCCTFEKYWNPFTLNARGLVLDSNHKVISKPFIKFFNLGELGPEYKLPSGLPHVSEKVDGSCICVFLYKDEWIFTTNGSFDSEQAKWAKEIHNKKYGRFGLNHCYTWIFEIIHPLDRKVVNYNEREDLVLLGAINNQTGEEVPILSELDYPQPKSFSGMDLKQLQEYKQSNFEGFVATYPNGFKVKIKLAEYIRLNRIISGLSTTRIWELLKNDQEFEEYIISLPEEHYDWAIKVKEDLLKEYNEIELKCKGIYAQLQGIKDRKSYAAAAKGHCDIAPILFKMLDQKKYDDIIWDLIKPDLIKYGQNE